MKKIMCLILALTFVLTGCSTTTDEIDNHEIKKSINGQITIQEDEASNKGIVIPYSKDDEIIKYLEIILYPFGRK